MRAASVKHSEGVWIDGEELEVVKRLLAFIGREIDMDTEYWRTVGNVHCEEDEPLFTPFTFVAVGIHRTEEGWWLTGDNGSPCPWISLEEAEAATLRGEVGE